MTASAASCRCARRRRRPSDTTVVERDDTEQAHLCLGWRSLANGDDDRWAMSVANQVLGGGMASRLFQEVREERGLAYSVYSHPTAFEDSGYLTIYCGTAPKRAREALAGDRRRRGARCSPTASRSPSWRWRPATSRGRCCSASRTAAGAWVGSGGSLMQRDRITTVDEHVERLRAVTTDDVGRVLHRVLDAPRALAAVGPFEVDELVG